MKILIAIGIVLLIPLITMAGINIDDTPTVGDDVTLNGATIYFDSHDARVVQIAGGLLADDFERVFGQRPAVKNDPAWLGCTAIIIGTKGQSALIDQLISSGKISVNDGWESYLWQTVTDPLPNVHHALVIAGSDRRGTAYGVVELSKRIGVSPWYWWADVPPTHYVHLRASAGTEFTASPEVKYRGIFLNDEDWGLRPWASKTLDPATGKMGPKTYARIFELMLRLRLNYIWPAMHPGENSSEFSTFPGNAETADQWAIVTGSSHCEPMLRNNVFWPTDSGPWRYDLNRDAIFNYWKESATTHGNFESVWTLGIRGIHDSAMQGPKELPARVSMVEHVFEDQRSLIDQLVTKKYGPPAECFVPYKEVLPLYDSGMKVPGDVTLVWPDDNFGYVRRLGTALERKRTGGSGVYYHLSYWGSPHSYLWVESTPPALMWEELRKLYDNDSKNIWIVNVGDIKPAEAAIDFFAQMAWRPSEWAADSQDKFLAKFDADTFGSACNAVHALQTIYYQLATVRKPEHISYAWIDSLSINELGSLRQRYQSLIDQEKTVAAQVPRDRADAYFEMVGYVAKMLGATGLLYSGDDTDAKQQKHFIDEQTNLFNEKIAGGKWRHIMSNIMEGVVWPSVVGGKAKPLKRAATRPANDSLQCIDAASFTSETSTSTARWQPVAGLGWSGHSVALFPEIPENHWSPQHLGSAPSMNYHFNSKAASNGSIRIHALPTLRLTPEMHLRIAVSIDNNAPEAIDIPGGSSDNELGKERREGVQANRVTMTISTGSLSPGEHVLKIYAVDPGVVLDQIDLPQ